MTLKKLSLTHKKLRVCKRCDELYRDAGMKSKVCPKCRLPNGSNKKVYFPIKNTNI